ncbi:putative ribonuclease H-like domain-containing protein, partial [Tanacetum coccineum]
VYVDDIIFGSTNKELCTGFEKLMKDKFQMSSMGELTFFLGLQVQQKEYGIFISGDKYVAEILKKFNYTDVKSASTPIDLEKPLVKYGDANDVDAHLYRSMIGSLMYLTTSRPDIIYLKGKPTLGLWYYRDSPFELVAYTDSDYAGATQDKKSTTKGCQFLGNMLISWQCKKQTMVATSTTEAEYVAAASCYEQVLWIQNQLLDYGYNFMNIVINIDNNSTICIIENPVQHSKTKHIKIGHHFIRDCNAKKLIQMVKIHIDYNVADLLTKGFDVGRHVKRGRDTKIPQSSGPPLKDGDEAIHKEFGDRMERAATTASSFEAEQDSGSGPRCQDTILGDVDAQTRFKTTSKQSNNPPLSRGYTLGSGEDSIKILELMELSTASTTANGEVKLTARIDGQEKTITKASLRRHQKEEPAPMSYELPLQSVYSLGRDEGSLSLNELTILCTTLSKKVEDFQIDLKQTKLTYGAAYTKVILRVKKLEKQFKTSKVRRRVRLVLSKDEDEDAEILEKNSTDTEILLDVEEPTELVEDQGSGEKVYIRRSAEKRKDKGKAIMTEPEPEQTSTKLKLRQERAGLEAAIRLQEQLNEEESPRITRDAKIARQLQEEINIAGEEKVVTEDDQSHDINWNDPSVIRFYAQQNRPFSKDKVRKNMCMYLKNQCGYKMSYFKGMS